MLGKLDALRRDLSIITPDVLPCLNNMTIFSHALRRAVLEGLHSALLIGEGMKSLARVVAGAGCGYRTASVALTGSLNIRLSGPRG